MWKKFRKLKKPRNLFFIGVLLVLFCIYYLYSRLHLKELEVNAYETLNEPRRYGQVTRLSKSFTRQKALVFLSYARSQVSKEIITILESVRFKFHVIYGEIKKLPNLTDDDKGKYAIIIFESMMMYHDMAKWSKDVLIKYSQDYEAGLLFFLKPQKLRGYRLEENDDFVTMKDYPLRYVSGVPIKNYELNTSSPVLRIAKAGRVWEEEMVSAHEWTIFQFDHPTFTAVSYASLMDPNKVMAVKKRYRRKSSRVLFAPIEENANPSQNVEEVKEKVDKFPIMVRDRGLIDGVEKIVIGGGFGFWLHRVLFLDAISHLSRGKLSISLDRYIQVDIDDMFVGSVGSRMNREDVDALVDFQHEVRQKFISNFTFQLGFSGKFIFRGTKEENDGDQRLLEQSSQFSWFPHMWSHMQAHWFNNTKDLCEYMELNYRFAVRHHFHYSSGYAVAPHHAGVFPVHKQLYECWSRVWNITVTSTEEYPHLRPDHKRRGFIHQGLKVLPRQTCGLYTHTIKLALYPGGSNVLIRMIDGGMLFQSVLFNKFTIFMTHLSNYGNDRLAIYTFDRLFNFLKNWTNFNLLQDTPSVIADKYFETFPEDKEPTWLNPCADKRHAEIWSSEKTCTKFPSFVIVGPQKTGTTALHSFLQIHPFLKTSFSSSKTFEEIQFFNDVNYFKGIEWYMDFFPIPNNDTLLFEKSANYFDNSVVPRRLHALLSESYIIVVLINPIKRAYSWYQHMRAHADPIALQYSFHDIIRSKRKNIRIKSLQRRCLDPGFYADHLERWLEYFPSRQIVVVDGEELVTNPIKVLHQLQENIELKHFHNYTDSLIYDNKKGFYCQKLPTGKVQCLGKGKGRDYSSMDDKSLLFLTKYYSESNKKLKRLLDELDKPIPIWLRDNNI